MAATLALGTMNFGRRTPENEARRIVDLALERGVTRFDTANLYCDGDSERIVGRALEGRREQVQLTTKVGAFKKEGLSRARIVAALDESLDRLRTSYVDVYLWHVPDPSTPFDESLDGIADVLASKKARAWGVSNFAAWQVLELMKRCDARGIPRPAHTQLLYNLSVRQLDVEYASFAAANRITTTIFNPLAGGLFAHDPSIARPGKARLETNGLYRRRYGSDVMKTHALAWKSLADEFGMSLVTLAYAFTFSRSFVDVVLAGPASVAHFEAALTASTVQLDDAQRAKVDARFTELTGTDASYAR